MQPQRKKEQLGLEGSNTPAALYPSVEWSDVLDQAAFIDTCAARVSSALKRSWVTIPGARMTINAGPLKGKRIEPGQDKLSNTLKRPVGAYKSENAGRDSIARRSGVV